MLFRVASDYKEHMHVYIIYKQIKYITGPYLCENIMKYYMLIYIKILEQYTVCMCCIICLKIYKYFYIQLWTVPLMIVQFIEIIVLQLFFGTKLNLLKYILAY